MREDNPAAVIIQSHCSCSRQATLPLPSIFILVVIMSLPHAATVTFPDIDSLLNPLTKNIDSHTTLISLCGAGGKTSTLFWLAEYFYKQGKKVLITTTTRMFLPAPSHYRELILKPIPSASSPAVSNCPINRPWSPSSAISIRPAARWRAQRPSRWTRSRGSSASISSWSRRMAPITSY